MIKIQNETVGPITEKLKKSELRKRLFSNLTYVLIFQICFMINSVKGNSLGTI